MNEHEIGFNLQLFAKDKLAYDMVDLGIARRTYSSPSLGGSDYF